MIRYAVIGIGRMGSIHANNLHAGLANGATLVAVCDIDEQKLNNFSISAPDVLTFGNYKDLVSIELDAVIIATPHYQHGEIARYFLDRNISVLSEKPQCVSVSESRLINECAGRSKALYGIMYNQRTNPVYKRAKEIISGGLLGSIRRVEMVVTHWYRSQFYYDQGGWRASWNGEGGGILINQCVHQLDVLQWLVGMPKTIRATCKTVNRNVSVENDVTATFEYDNGATGVFVASGHELYGTNRLEIAGERGKITIDDYNLTFIQYANSEIEVNLGVTEGYGSTECTVEKLSYGGEYRQRDEKYGQQLRVVEAFTDALSGKGTPVAYGSEGINALSVINGIYLSNYCDKKVAIPLDGEEYDILLNQLKEGEQK
ncbi:MAG: Gfo/Idh/MocA family oxidoreductase [Clostridia bacterium]|nr:Gfo/Idh/MocA family oxidoreductase [Clostridia bacterium]